MIKRIVMVLVMVVGAGFPRPAAFAQQPTECPPECVTDSMEIVTWYPSPYNEYEELRLYPISDSNSQCDSDNRGLMYYDSEEDKVKLCKGPVGLNNWQDLSGGADWEASGNDIYNTNSGNVGIGTTSPRARLEVNDSLILAPRVGNPSSWSGQPGELVFSQDKGKLYFTSDGSTWQEALSQWGPNYSSLRPRVQWNSAVAGCLSLSENGFNNWYLPSLAEAQNLVGVVVYPNEEAWTSDQSGGLVRTINYDFGTTGGSWPTENHPYYCVR